MNNFNKYFSLVALLIAGFLSFLLLLILIFYVLKLFSITFLNIPGSENIFNVVIILVPYILYYAAYYYLHKKISLAKTTLAKKLGWAFLLVGTALCTFTLILSFMLFFKLNFQWLRTFESNSQYAFIVQIFFIFFTAGSIATGDAKEKDWMERENSKQ